MKTKPGTTFNLDSALVGRKVTNSAGFNSAATRLGSDSQPGPGPGGPLMNSRSVDDGAAKLTRYPNGISPGSLSADQRGVLGPGVVHQNAGRTPDNPVPDNAPLPHPDLMTKADEAAFGERVIGNEPSGTLAR
jgi:hypothetical protein